MSLTKVEIIDLICENNDYSRGKNADIVENLLEVIKGTLENGDDLLISGFGKFSIQEKSERRGRNPTTGDDMMLPARRVVTFKCSGVLRDKINK